MADADRLVAALRYQQEMEDASRPVTVNPLMARKAEAIKQNAPAENMLTQYAETMPQNWQQFGQNMAQSYPTPATGGTRDQIMGAVTQAAVNAGPLMTVYHGSPHRFDKFDASKIGTGEGAQAYGHGLYLAENPAVANEYRRTLREMNPSYDGVQINDTVKKTAAELLMKAKGDKAAAIKDAQNYAFDNLLIPEINKMDAGKVSYGQLYKVDLPDEQIAKMLDWDKPLNSKFIKTDATQEYGGFAPFIGEHRVAMPARSSERMAKRLPSGSEVYSELYKKLGSADKVAEYLRQQGIPGIRYLDQGSRAAGEGTSNFVVFPGNEGLLKILDRK